MADIIAQLIAIFEDLEEWIPGAGNMARDIIVGRMPEAQQETLRELAQAWGNAAQVLGGAYEEVALAGDEILRNWSGDGAATQFAEQWFDLLEAMRSTADSLNSLQAGVNSYALQVELQKFMVALNLAVLIGTLVGIIISAFFTGGVSLSSVIPAFMTAGRLIGLAASATIRAISSISIRALLKSLAVFLVRVAPAVLRTTAPALVREAISTLVRTLPTLVRPALSDAVRAALPVIGRGAASIGRSFLPSNLARGLMPRNVIARALANRLAAQATRGMVSRAVLRGLVTETAERGLTALGLRGAAAIQNQLARTIELQLLERFGTRIGTAAVERSISAGAARLVGDAALQTAQRQALNLVAREIGEVSLGRELARYLGLRIAGGAAIMGGGNLVGQVWQISQGHRGATDIWWEQAGTYAFQGAALGAGMWGSPLGHTLGGALTGGASAAAVSAYQHATGDRDGLGWQDWTDIWGEASAGAAHGAVAGAIFGTLTHVRSTALHLPLKIGQEVQVVPTERGLGMILTDRAAGVEAWTSPGKGAAWFRVEGGPVPEGGRLVERGLVDAEGVPVFRQAFEPVRTQIDASPVDTAPPARGPLELASVDLPAGDGSPALGPHAGGDGGPPDGPGAATPGPVVPEVPGAGATTATPEPPALPPADPARVPLDIPRGEAARLATNLKLAADRPLNELTHRDIDRILGSPERYDPTLVRGVQQHFARQISDGSYRALPDAEIRLQAERLDTTVRQHLSEQANELTLQRARWEAERSQDPDSMELFNRFEPPPPEPPRPVSRPSAFSGREAWQAWADHQAWQAERSAWEAGVERVTREVWSERTRLSSPRLASEVDNLLRLRQADGSWVPMNRTDTVRVLDRLYEARAQGDAALRDAYARLRDEAAVGGTYSETPVRPAESAVRPAETPVRPAGQSGGTDVTPRSGETEPGATGRGPGQGGGGAPRPAEDHSFDTASIVESAAATRIRAPIDVEGLRAGYREARLAAAGGPAPTVPAHGRDLYVGGPAGGDARADPAFLATAIEQALARVPPPGPMRGVASSWRTTDLQPVGDGLVAVRFRDGTVVEARIEPGRIDSGAPVRVEYPDLWFDEVGRGRPAGPVRILLDERLGADHLASRPAEVAVWLRQSLNEVHRWLITPPEPPSVPREPGTGRPPVPGAGTAPEVRPSGTAAGAGETVRPSYTVDVPEAGPVRAAPSAGPRVAERPDTAFLDALLNPRQTAGGELVPVQRPTTPGQPTPARPDVPDASGLLDRLVVPADEGRLDASALPERPDSPSPDAGPPGDRTAYRIPDEEFAQRTDEAVRDAVGWPAPVQRLTPLRPGVWKVTFLNGQEVTVQIDEEPASIVDAVGYTVPERSLREVLSGTVAGPVLIRVGSRFADPDPAAVRQAIQARVAHALAEVYRRVAPEPIEDRAAVSATTDHPVAHRLVRGPARVQQAIEDYLARLGSADADSPIRGYQPIGPNEGVATLRNGVRIPIRVHAGGLPEGLLATARVTESGADDTTVSWVADIVVSDQITSAASRNRTRQAQGVLGAQLWSLYGWLDRIGHSARAKPSPPATPARPAASDPDVATALRTAIAGWARPGSRTRSTARPPSTSWVAAADPNRDGSTRVWFRDGSSVAVRIGPGDLADGVEARIAYPEVRYDQSGVAHPVAPVELVISDRMGWRDPQHRDEVVGQRLRELLDQVHDWLTAPPGSPGRAPAAAQGKTVSFRLVPVPASAVGAVAELPEAVRDAFDAHLDTLLRGRPVQAPDQPYRLTWDPVGERLTVHYPDGLSVWFAPQVNSALPAGRPLVVRPNLARADDRWVQADPAVVALPAHASADPAERADLVERQLADAWRTLHGELRDVLPPQPPPDVTPSDVVSPDVMPWDVAHPDDALTREARPAEPRVGPDQVQFRDAEPVAAPAPQPLTPDWVRARLADPALPPQMVRWIQEHLAVPEGDGRYPPKSEPEIEATVARLREEAARAVAAPEPHPADEEQNVPAGAATTTVAGVLHPLPRASLGYRRQPSYLDEARLAEARLTIAAEQGPAGRVAVRDAQGRRFDSRRLAPDGVVLWAMGTDGALYAVAPEAYTHASFPGPLAGIGTMAILDGEVVYLDGDGTDLPAPPEYLRQVVDVLERAGVDLTDKVLYPTVRPPPDAYGVAQQALDAAVDDLALRLDTALVAGIEGLPGLRVRLLRPGRPPIEVDMSVLAPTLAARLPDSDLRPALVGWLDTKLAQAVAGEPSGGPDQIRPEPASPEVSLRDAVRRVTAELFTDWTVTAAGEHVAVARPVRGRPVAFRLVDGALERDAAGGSPSTEPRRNDIELDGLAAVEVLVPAPLLADPTTRDLLVKRALRAHAVEVDHARTGPAGLARRLLGGRPRPDALGPNGNGFELSVADEQQVAQLRTLVEAFQQARPGTRTVIAREILALDGAMFKPPGRSGSFTQYRLVGERIPQVGDLLARLRREYGQPTPEHGPLEVLTRLAAPGPRTRSALGDVPAPLVGATGPVPSTTDIVAPVETADDGAAWVVRLPDDVVRRAERLDSHAVDALTGYVEGLLRAAADPVNWRGGRPPGVRLRAPDGIDALLARRLEHVRVPFDARDAAGQPVSRPRATVSGPRRFTHLPQLALPREIVEQDARDRIPYLRGEARERLRVQWRDGLAYDADGVPLDGLYDFAMEPGTLTTFARGHQVGGLGNLKHSSFLAGGNALAVGEFLVANGRVQWIDNRSGHYLPTIDHLWPLRDMIAGRPDTAKADLLNVGADATAYSRRRGERAFATALAEVAAPGEMAGVVAIHRVSDSPVARRDGAGVPGVVLRVSTVDGRSFDVDASGVHNYLTAARPAGADAAHFDPDRRVFIEDSQLAWQAAEWLRALIELELTGAPERSPAPAQASGWTPHGGDGWTPHGGEGTRRDTPASAEARQRLGDSLVRWLAQDQPAQLVYEVLREEVYRAGADVSVVEAARVADEAVAARHGSANTRWYARLLTDWLATPEGRAYHDGLTALDLAAARPWALPRDSARFLELTRADAERVHADQGGDWSPPLLAALQRYAETAGWDADTFVKSNGSRSRAGRADAFRLQATMRALGREALLHAAVPVSALGIESLAELPRLLGQVAVHTTFLPAWVGSAPGRLDQITLEIEAPAETRMAWLGRVRADGETADLLLAAGTRLRVLGIGRRSLDSYTLRVRVAGQHSPPVLATPLLGHAAVSWTGSDPTSPAIGRRPPTEPRATVDRHPAGVHLPADVRMLVDREILRLRRQMAGEPPDARLASLAAIGAQADRIAELVAEARGGGRAQAGTGAQAGAELAPLRDALRGLSRLIRAYRSSYREPENWPDPLDPVTVSGRVVGMDPQTHRFHPLDQALAGVLVEAILEPDLAAHVVAELASAVPLDVTAAEAVLGERGRNLAAEILASGHFAGYSWTLGVQLVRPHLPLTEFAATVVHESLHALQPERRQQVRAIAEAARTDRERDLEKARLTLRRERPAYRLQRDFLRGLVRLAQAVRPDPRAAVPDRYAWLLGPDEEVDAVIVRRHVGAGPGGEPDPRTAPETVVVADDALDLVAHIEASGDGPPADAFAEPERTAAWDALSAGGLDERVAALKARADLPVPEKLRYIREELYARTGYRPSPVRDLDAKNLRVYGWQSGELFIHAAAAVLDRQTTIEVGYHEPDRGVLGYQREAGGSFLRHLGPLPQGVSVAQADAVLAWRALSGRPTAYLDTQELADDLVDLHLLGLREALTMRERLIEEYGVDPRRVRLVYDDQHRSVHYVQSRFARAHLFALDQLRGRPGPARQALVEAMRGRTEQARRDREARVGTALSRLYAAHEADGTPGRYALLWIRDTRAQPGGAHFYDTRPEFIRQAIELLRRDQPDRRVVLVGDDLFVRRPELREAWHRAGVLDGVDTDTLVRFWDAGRNGGRALGVGEQGLFFHRLNAERDVVQIGMESGALEIPALLGMPSVYFEALEHDGNKGVRWQYYWDSWLYGRSVPVEGPPVEGPPVEAPPVEGPPVFDTSGRPVKEFRASGKPLPAPLSTFQRVQFGPDLPDPTDREGWAVAVHHLAKVTITADRLTRLVDGGEVDRWAHRLGRRQPADGGPVRPWDDTAWQVSHDHADQLRQWLRIEAADERQAAGRWDAIGLALAAVLDPHADAATRYRDAGYRLPPSGDERLARAYQAPVGRRPDAVARLLRDWLGGRDLRMAALHDVRLFRLQPAEVAELSRTIARVQAEREALSRLTPFGGDPAGGAAAGARPDPDLGGSTGRPRPPPPRGSQIVATGRQPRSEVDAEADRVREWDALASGQLDALVVELKARTDMTVTEKLRYIREDLFGRVGYEPAYVGGNLDLKNLRCYEWQSGELFIHAAAMMLDREATIEVAYEPYHYFTQFRDKGYDPFLANLGEVPEGLTRDLVDMVVLWRWLRRQPITDVDPATLADDAIDMQIRPLRNALTMRDRLIQEYGIEPHRVRLCYDNQPPDVHYANTKFRRAHLVALPRVREAPVEARRVMVEAMRGTGARGEIREARARGVLQRVYAQHEGPSGPARRYALLWVRNTRMQAGGFMDTKPEMLRQTVETLRAMDPGRQMMLIGDDPFAGQPELRAQFEAERVFDGVDTQTLVQYWTRTDGPPLGHGEQGLFLHYLDAERDVVQIGMESGALDTPVTMGIPTVYFQAREHVWDKGIRWQLYWDEWSYGRSAPARDETGKPIFAASGPVKTFEPIGEPLPAPLTTIRRVEFGPDLADPAESLAPVAVHHPATISITADRIATLLEGGELDQWSRRLGRSWVADEGRFRAWDEHDWDASRYHAGQLHAWLAVHPPTLEAAAHRWDSVRRALAGALDPHSPEVSGVPQHDHQASQALPPDEWVRIRRAYSAPLPVRALEVTELIKARLGAADVHRQATNDWRKLRLEPEEIQRLRDAISHVVSARRAHRRLTPFTEGTAGTGDDGPFRGASQDAPGGQRGPAVSIRQVKMALGRAGMSVVDHDLVHQPTIIGPNGLPAYGVSPHTGGQPLRGPLGRPLILLSDIALASMEEAVLTIFHEIYHHRMFALTGLGGSESAAEAYGQRMLEQFRRRTR